jgi:Divergent InlB B-repeat domain
MKQRNVGFALSVVGALVALGAVSSLPSCGHDQKLVSVTVQPQTFTFLQNVPGSTTNYTAIGTYIHPPATKDISSQVTWNTDIPQVATMASGATVGGTLTTQGSCGIADISASAPEGTGGASNIVIGYGSVTVNDPTNPICPGGSATNGELVVTPAGSGVGTTTSQPGGINCPGVACGAQFPAGDLITLTASAGTNSTFTSWTGCTADANANQCTVTIPGGGIVNVTATFTSTGP